ncbi:MAG: hypothetical protein Q8922_00305 [Bacteroidota bacterium]|nr:hypothetical protein [Bacteroidota bacterium]MDP4232475.1 hypothetical protein [Bacteroidota bacterium]MDP4286355.1 hypothetical protein [Bacteroidota bacterium]
MAIGRRRLGGRFLSWHGKILACSSFRNADGYAHYGSDSKSAFEWLGIRYYQGSRTVSPHKSQAGMRAAGLF